MLCLCSVFEIVQNWHFNCYCVCFFLPLACVYPFHAASDEREFQQLLNDNCLSNYSRDNTCLGPCYSFDTT